MSEFSYWHLSLMDRIGDIAVEQSLDMQLRARNIQARQLVPYVVSSIQLDQCKTAWHVTHQMECMAFGIALNQ